MAKKATKTTKTTNTNKATKRTSKGQKTSGPNNKTAKAPVTATKGAKTRLARASRNANIMGLATSGWVRSAEWLSVDSAPVANAKRGLLFVLAGEGWALAKEELQQHLAPWQMAQVEEKKAESQFFSGVHGPVWVIYLSVMEPQSQHHGLLDRSEYARARDLVGAAAVQSFAHQLDHLLIETEGLNESEEAGVLVGLECASYSFVDTQKNLKKKTKRLPQLVFLQEGWSLSEEKSLDALATGTAVNLARHLVNLPGNALNPKTMVDVVKALFAKSSTTQIEVWNKARLMKEKMHLLLAVGHAGSEEPCMIHLRYRPKGMKKRKPVAFVGKGITFDTGGLDIKPSSAMRWMKKDMGGSAAVVGLAYWVEQVGLNYPCDFYLAMAENGVGQGAMRPGDVITARSGLTVEIHNTDAEGRLVLADVLDVAVKQKGADQPAAVLDLATLTGAIKVGLGADVAGLFANNDDLAELLLLAGVQRGELNWRMPLVKAYQSLYRSNFADVANCSDGFGGAITAALFLEEFVGQVPWAHLDIYAWKDSASGIFAEAGGNGQPVQLLSYFLREIESRGEFDEAVVN